MAAFSNKTKDYTRLFSDTMIETFQILRLVHPDQRFLMKVEGKYIKTERNTYIQYTLNNIKPHVSYLCSQDASIFESGYLDGRPLHLLVGMDFKKFWQVLSKETQEQLFIQLQLLFIYGSLATHTNKPLVRDMIANLKFTQEIDQRVAEAEAKEREKSQFNIESLLGKNSPLVTAFMELSQDKTLIQELEKLSTPQAPQETSESSGPSGPSSLAEPSEPSSLAEPPGPSSLAEPPGLSSSAEQFSPAEPTGLASLESLLETDKLMSLFMGIVQSNNLEKAFLLIRERIELKLKEKNLGPTEIEEEIKKAIARARSKFAKHPIYQALQADKIIDNLMNSANNNQEDFSFSDISEKVKGFMGMMQNNAQKNQHIDPEKMAKIAEMMKTFQGNLNNSQNCAPNCASNCASHSESRIPMCTSNSVLHSSDTVPTPENRESEESLD